ncbi:hypothetical protein [Marinobacter sp. P4B1]|uniref:hypothetical protein n=1 Tax=Marinobacter sp. P4B1 TaxID=1119533 RepID=UPI00071E5FE8|nr:hypothetical protein [Marinobacter sp. P4B1]KRW83638.1 hypothetical protein AQ621_16450 [Marinobacter sp. P4B1]
MGGQIRVILKVNEDSHPDLYADLEKVDPRRRGERLRLLATSELRSHFEGRVQVQAPRKHSKATASSDAKSGDNSPKETPREVAAAKDQQPTQEKPEEKDQYQDVRNSILGGMANQF